MASEDPVIKSRHAADDDGQRSESAAEEKSARAERARAPVPLSHQVAGHKHGVHKVGQFTLYSLSLLSSYSA